MRVDTLVCSEWTHFYEVFLMDFVMEFTFVTSPVSPDQTQLLEYFPVSVLRPYVDAGIIKYFLSCLVEIAIGKMICVSEKFPPLVKEPKKVSCLFSCYRRHLGVQPPITQLFHYFSASK